MTDDELCALLYLLRQFDVASRRREPTHLAVMVLTIDIERLLREAV